MVDVSNKQNSVVITVAGSNGNTNVTAKSDTAQYWSNASKKYSEDAKISANLAEQAKNEVIAQKDSVIDEIEGVRAGAVESVTAVATTGVASVEQKVNSGIANIESEASEGVNLVNTAKINAVNEVNTNKTNAVNAVKTEGQNQVKNIKATGFYMENDKLYFINSKGEKEEFKSGGGRFIGESFHSLLPINDAGVHLVDGALIDGSGSYAEFVSYIADLYENSTEQEITTNVGTIPTLTSNENVTLVGTMYDGVSWAYKVFPNSSGDTSWTTASGSVTYTYNETERPTAGTYKISFNHGSYNVANRTLNNVVVTLTFTDGTTQDIAIGNFTETIPTCSAYYESGVFAVGKTVASITFSHSGSKISTTTQCVQNLQLTQITKNGIAGFCTENEWQTSVARYGVCGKFVYDNVANTVRLPKVTGFIEGTIDLNALGQLVEAGLPNITAYGAKLGYRGLQTFSGAFYNDGTNGQEGSYGANFNVNYNVGFDASRSNPIYGNSPTVQPQSVKGYIYMVIATSTKTDVQVNLDNIATDLNGKADVDLSNTNDTAKVLMGRMAMPSNRYIDLTLGASGTRYTAPADGYYVLNMTSGGAHFMCITNMVTLFQGYMLAPSGSWQNGVWAPVKKGDVVEVAYNYPTLNWFRFVYAVGSESEA